MARPHRALRLAVGPSLRIAECALALVVGDDGSDVLPGEFSRLFGRIVSLDGCELRTIAGRNALYLEFDGALPGTKTIQYQLQRNPRETLILTATARSIDLPRMLSEFEAMVSSIRPL